jgi:hypothetical protein
LAGAFVRSLGLRCRAERSAQTSLDVAVFSLSLMGTDGQEYRRDTHRTVGAAA